MESRNRTPDDFPALTPGLRRFSAITTRFERLGLALRVGEHTARTAQPAFR